LSKQPFRDHEVRVDECSGCAFGAEPSGRSTCLTDLQSQAAMKIEIDGASSATDGDHVDRLISKQIGPSDFPPRSDSQTLEPLAFAMPASDRTV
jgi:hypothetical protein